jgi:hypothetical protein
MSKPAILFTPSHDALKTARWLANDYIDDKADDTCERVEELFNKNEYSNGVIVMGLLSHICEIIDTQTIMLTSTENGDDHERDNVEQLAHVCGPRVITREPVAIGRPLSLTRWNLEPRQCPILIRSTRRYPWQGRRASKNRSVRKRSQPLKMSAQIPMLCRRECSRRCGYARNVDVEQSSTSRACCKYPICLIQRECSRARLPQQKGL